MSTPSPAQMPPIPPAPKSKKIGCWIWGIIGLGILMLVGFVFVLIIGSFRSGTTFEQFPETMVESQGIGAKKIVVIDLEGVIDHSGGESSMAGKAIAMIRQAREDHQVVAVVLRINSPGGGVTASDQIYHAVQQLRQAGKPVVAYMDSIAASGGFYVACAADEVLANETTLTGSIGVIIASYNVTELMSKVGVKPTVIKSGDFKDILSPTREMRPEEQAYLQAMVMESYEKFLGLVSESTGLSKERLRDGIADGRIMSGAKAKELGLIDGCGYMEDAIASAKRLAKVDKASVVHYEDTPSFRKLLGLSSMKSSGKVQVELKSAWLPQMAPGVPYLLPEAYAGGFSAGEVQP